MLITEKTFCFEISDGRRLTAYVREFFTTESQTVYTWPSAILLASYILAANVVEGCRIIELGAGCGLPSIVAALAGARACALTERAAEPLILQNIAMNVQKNKVANICTVIPLNWKSTNLQLLPEVDVILGADIFYSSEDFEYIISLVDHIMVRNDEVVFYTTYQERSTRRNISPYLEKYSMIAEVIPADSFLHVSHTTDGVCGIIETTQKSTLRSDSTDSCVRCIESDAASSAIASGDSNVQLQTTKTISLETFDCISLLKIIRKKR